MAPSSSTSKIFSFMFFLGHIRLLKGQFPKRQPFGESQLVEQSAIQSGLVVGLGVIVPLMIVVVGGMHRDQCRKVLPACFGWLMMPGDRFDDGIRQAP